MAKKMLPPMHLCCADDDNREAVNYIEILDGIATATNSTLISRLNLRAYSNLTDEALKALNGKRIHKDVWKTIADADEIIVAGDVLSYIKGAVAAEINISSSPKFINYQPIIDVIANSDFDKKSFLCLNPKLIMIAAKLFPMDFIVCRFYKSSENIVLFPAGQPHGFIAIAPIRIEAENATLDFSLT